MGEIKLDGYLCERCEHTWLGRNGSNPLVCPRCKSPYWNTPRKNGVSGKDVNNKKEDFGLFPAAEKKNEFFPNRKRRDG